MEAPKFKASVNSTSNQADSKLHFLDYWRIIRIRKTVILAVFLLVVLTTTAVTFVLPETYMSFTRIEVNKDTSGMLGLIPMQQGPNTIDPYFINTEFEKIKSEKVLNTVIEDLKLAEVWAKKYKSDSNLKLNEVTAMLSRQIDVRQFRNTSLIEIRAYSDDKKEAQTIAQKIAEVYQKTRIAVKQAQSLAGVVALQDEYAKQKTILEAKQKEVDDLRGTLQISEMGSEAMQFQSVLEPEIVRMIQKTSLEADSQYTHRNTLLKGLKAMDKASLRKAIPTAMGDDSLNKYLIDLAIAEQRYEVTSKTLGEDHPELLTNAGLIKLLNTQIDEKIEGMIKGLESTVTQARALADAMNQKLEEAKAMDAQKRKTYAPFFRAQRELDNQKRINDAIFMRMLQESVDQKMPTGGIVEIIDSARLEDKPVRPNITLNIALGVVVGLIMGFGLAFFIEYLDTSVKTIDDVERALQAPVLGVIPQNVGSLLVEGVDSPHAEAYRVLRTNLLFSRKSPDARTLTVVSGGAGEGKSTTIFNLATVFAQNGHKVLLVDSDLRRPSLHKLLNVSNSIGLTNFLLRQNTIEEVVQTTALPTLHFLPSGKLPSSSLGILNSAAMREFITKAKERYDFVFFDSPPIMGVSDASILASEVDMAMLVIQYRKYPQVMTVRAKQMVEKVGGNLLGVVLNNINISQDSYYYYYSGYYYDYYSKQDDGPGKSGGSRKNGEAKKNAAAAASTATPASGDRGGIDLKQKY